MPIYGAFKQIPPYDISRTTFNTYKQWNLSKQNFLSASLDSDDHITLLVAQKPDPNLYSGGVVTYESFQATTEPKNENTIYGYVGDEFYTSAVWYSINHVYYNKLFSNDSFTNVTGDNIVNNLYATASVISIPQRYFGDTIKPGSLNLTLEASTGIQLTAIDDTNTNVIDTRLSSSVAINNQKLYLGFNKFDHVSVDNYNIPFSPFTYIAQGVTYNSSDIYQFYGTNTGSIGLNATFTGTGYIQIRESGLTPSSPKLLGPEYDEEFALSFWLFVNSNVSTNASNYNYIISKRREGMAYVQINNFVEYNEIDLNKIAFPYEIRIQNSGSAGTSTILSAVRSDGTNTVEVSSSILVGNQTGAYTGGLNRNAYHVVYQKSGSMMQLYLNGTLVNSSTDTTNFDFNNNCDLFIGNLGKNHGGFAGTVDELFFFNKALTSTEITQLSTPEYCTNTNIIGNIFYQQGIVCISDPRPKYNYLTGLCASWNGGGPAFLNKYNVSYKSKVPINEVEVLCRLKENEFNFTTNPTSLVDYRYPEQIGSVTSSYWTPFISTIGLYDDSGSLLAVGKLANPIPKINEAELNFIVRFDI